MRPKRVKFDGYFPDTPPALEPFCCYSVPANVDNLEWLRRKGPERF